MAAQRTPDQVLADYEESVERNRRDQHERCANELECRRRQDAADRKEKDAADRKEKDAAEAARIEADNAAKRGEKDAGTPEVAQPAEAPLADRAAP